MKSYYCGIIVLYFCSRFSNLLVSVPWILPGCCLGVMVDVITTRGNVCLPCLCSVNNTHNFPVRESNFMSQPGGRLPLSSAILASATDYPSLSSHWRAPGPVRIRITEAPEMICLLTQLLWPGGAGRDTSIDLAPASLSQQLSTPCLRAP